ncbi:transposase [bacterium]|nr:transposase [bacterium]
MRQWPHSPVHRFSERGTYIVTAGAYGKQKFFNTPGKLAFLHDRLLELAGEFELQLQAWAVFSNHYHFVAILRDYPESIRRMISKLHTLTAIYINRLDTAPGRKVWFQYWDTELTFERSILARLNYVNNNAVHHRLVEEAKQYPYCSAS